MRLLYVIGVAALSSAPLSAFASGQVSTRTVAPERSPDQHGPFDGSVNFLGDAPEAYVGQDLFLPGIVETLRPFGWRNFCTSLPCTITTAATVSYRELAGKYLHVEAVEVTPNELGVSKVFVFTLTEKASGTTWYYRYDSLSMFSFPFVAVKYFEREKAHLVGKRFVSRGWSFYASDGVGHDINSGKPVSFSPGTAWKCGDVTIEERFFEVVMILQNEKGEQIPFLVKDVNDPYLILSAEEAARIERVDGKATYRSILEKKVRLGMSKRLVELSWGKPRSVNRTVSTGGGVSEQWVYSDNYVYFDKSRVTGIQ
jgi:hypothetical protein